MEVIEGVHTIEGLGVGRAYLYQEADRLTLIDSGLPGSAERIFGAIERIGRKPEDLRQIIITHYHRDHTGSLAELVERTGAQGLVHALDAPVGRGGGRPAHAPGPTLGSIAVYAPAKRLLFTGDAAANAFGLGPPSGPFGLFNE